MEHKGSCHCGAVTFTVEAPATVEVFRCNCSLCAMTGFLHLIVSKAAFTLRTGAENLTEYRFNSGIARHLFCRTCGVKSFYVPRSHPDGYSVNLNCLDQSRFTRITPRDFDGQNWEANIEGIR